MSNASSPARHTSGPWEVDFYGTGILARFTGPWKYICQHVRGDNPAEQYANACLIAAAPELLEALKKTTSAAGAWLRAVDRHVPENLFEKIMADIGTQYDGFGVEARAAIAKAEGVLPETGAASADKSLPEAT